MRKTSGWVETQTGTLTLKLPRIPADIDLLTVDMGYVGGHTYEAPS
jgi:hypothetical protein